MKVEYKKGLECYKIIEMNILKAVQHQEFINFKY